MSSSISQLNIYPIKSCAGIGLNSALIGNRGFYFDRLWMLVDENNKFMTQRTHASMALIRADLLSRATKEKILDEISLVQPSPELDVISRQPDQYVTLVLTAPGMPSLTLNPVHARSDNTYAVTIWRDICMAVDEGNEAAEWLSSYLNFQCRLVRMQEDVIRQVDQQYAESEIDQVGFADGYPFLLISESSLQDLNDKLAERLPMNRFRPNIVVQGCEAFAEDSWQKIRINGIDFALVKPCARCSITTTDQMTARVGPEPLRTLAKYRTNNNKVLFGQNLVHNGRGQLKLGDQVEIVTIRDSLIY